MSDPMTNVDIEDVLASIRRLVSEDARPRSATPPLFAARQNGDARAGRGQPDPVPSNPVPSNPVQPHQHVADLVQPEPSDPVHLPADRDPATPDVASRVVAHVAGEPGAVAPIRVGRLQPDRLVLTPSLRIMDTDADFAPVAAPVAAQPGSTEAPADPPVAAQPWQDPAARLVDVWPADAPPPAAQPDPASSSDAVALTDSDMMPSPDTINRPEAAPIGPADAGHAPARAGEPSDASVAIGDGGHSTDTGTQTRDALADATDLAEYDALAWEDHRDDAEDDTEDDTGALANAPENDFADDLLNDPAQDFPDAPLDPFGGISGNAMYGAAMAAPVRIVAAAPHSAAHQQPLRDLQPDTVAEPASAPPVRPQPGATQGARHDAPTGPAHDSADRDGQDADADMLTEDTVIDEAMLRELVADIVRQELMGALGERITRNVRKLVRREIHRALSAQDFE